MEGVALGTRKVGGLSGRQSASALNQFLKIFAAQFREMESNPSLSFPFLPVETVARNN